MAINISENGRLFNLHTKNTTYQFKADKYDYLIHTYYGDLIDDTDLYTQLSAVDRGFSGNPYEIGKEDRKYSLDTLPLEYSCFGTGDFRISALKVRENTGNQTVELKYDGYEVKKGLYKIEGLPAVYTDDGTGETLIVKLKDIVNGLSVSLFYGIIEEKDIIVRSAVLTNKGKETLWLEKTASACLDLPFGDYDMLSFYGRHNMERNLSRRKIDHGITAIGSTRGTSSHHYNPFVILAESSATEEFGRCFGLSFVYSGNFLMETEKDQTGLTRVLCGINPEEFSWKLNSEESFYTPQVIMSYSGHGISGLSDNYHRVIVENIIRGKWKNKKCPVLINNWEATYFDFNGEKIEKIAEESAQMGVELFVLDDGWFGKRDNDNCALGDWYPNEKKLGCTLKELGETIISKGMHFGLWFEPEAISEDSDLYRQHPDWALTTPGRKPSVARNQLVLDYSRKDVLEYIIDRMEDILSTVPISYVKWDMNRSICDKYSSLLPADRQGELAHRYVLGLYYVLEKLTQDFPDVLFEGCSGGGGRFDAGMLYYTPQIWCSDNTDAINRLRIQYGTSFGYPPRTMGSHVSASPNHQTGRSTTLRTRAAVAMAGTFGYELDVSILKEEEKQEIKEQIKFLKEHNELLFNGHYYRLTVPEDICCAWEFADRDKNEALVFSVCYRVEGNLLPLHIKPKGLEPDIKYMVSESGWYETEKDKEPLVLSGSAIMNAGITLPVPREDGDVCIIHIKNKNI
ncbi:MAG: alpha-galactosidase [Lachnospiraceae bacterium]|nr:alpha-galactosidase [Lachnospiraceae bacterium]